MAKFNSLKIAQIKQETKDCITITFEIPALLQSSYKFKHGQYLTLKTHLNNDEQRRSYSISSDPFFSDKLTIAVKTVDGGLVSNWLHNEVKEGHEMEVMTPMGHFNTPLAANQKKSYSLFAGGSGITPMMAIIKAVLREEPLSTITLFFASRNEEQIIFKAELESLEASANGRLKVVHVLSQPMADRAELLKGRMNPLKVKALIENYGNLKSDTEYFICGPNEWMQMTEATLKNDLKISASRLHLEYFTTATLPTEPTHGDLGSAVSRVTVIMDGDEATFDLAANGKSILDAAMDADLDAPFSCKGAVCCTCRAKVMEGEVVMDQNFALSDDEVAEGYILTCQAHPVSAKVVVDFDEA